MKFKAKIKYKVDGNHPDIQDLPTEFWYGKDFTYEDTYTFDNDEWSFGEAVRYMENDMKIVAGGGYNSSHIYDVHLVFEEVM